MARRNHSLLDDLVTLPWWFNVILAAIVYVSLRFWLPTFEFQNPAFKGIATGAPNVAHIFAGVLLLVAAISAFNAWRKGRLLERQTGIDSLNAVSWREFEELVGEAPPQSPIVPACFLAFCAASPHPVRTSLLRGT